MDRVRTSVIGSLILVSALGTQFRPTPSPKNPVPETQSIETPNTTNRASSNLVNASSWFPHNEDGPWSALCHYFAIHDPDVIGNRGGCLPNGLGGIYRLRFLITTVPDPFHSSMTMEYDRTLESIERAAAFAGYTIDRYWLPWDQIYLQPQTDLVKTRTLSRDQHLRENQPGLLLFHCVDQLDKPPCTPLEKTPTDKKHLHTHLLLVFLAGETPSSGINKVAFANAVHYIQELRTNKVGMKTDDSKPDELRLAGPRFSGSLHALKVALLQLGNPALRRKEPPDQHQLPKTIRIVTGATSRSAIQEFCEVPIRSIALDDLNTCKITLPRAAARNHSAGRCRNRGAVERINSSSRTVRSLRSLHHPQERS